MYLAKTPDLLKPLYKDLLWHVDTDRNELYLTFDDGPVSDVTPWVLETLRSFKAKATFFCVGRNVEQHPEIFAQIKEEGHSIGSHCYDHENGWQTRNRAYFRSVIKGMEITGSSLFRPPYGRITRDQAKLLLRRCRIVMWDVLSGDFDPKASPERCLDNVNGNASKGSIVVFHDSEKAYERLAFALPKVLQHYEDLGFTFKGL